MSNAKRVEYTTDAPVCSSANVNDFSKGVNCTGEMVSACA